MTLMLKLAKISFLVDIVLGLWQRIPAPVIHNLSKAQMLKLIFWHLNVDQKPGFYMEFGVAHGHSMKAAILANRFAKSKQLGVVRLERTFFGVDTFEGFKSDNPLDVHPVWNADKFTRPIDEIEQRFRKEDVSVLFLKIDATTLNNLSDVTVLDFKSSIKGPAAILLFDMDLFEPTISALRWVSEFIDEGTFIMFDEFFAFQASLEKGEARAFREFSQSNPHLIFREFATYGSGGKVFVLSKSYK